MDAIPPIFYGIFMRYRPSYADPVTQPSSPSTMANQISAVALAYFLLLNMCWIVDAVLHTYLSIGLVVWINLGVLVLKSRHVLLAVPSKRYIDIVEAIRILFQASTWPVRY